MKLLQIIALALCLNVPMTHAMDEICTDNMYTALSSGCCALAVAALGYCKINSMDQDIQDINDRVQQAIDRNPHELGDEENVLSDMSRRMRSETEIETDLRQRIGPDRRQDRRALPTKIVAAASIFSLACAYFSYASYACYFTEK